MLGWTTALSSRANVSVDSGSWRSGAVVPGGRAADENGLFLFRGVAPGRYLLVGWQDEPPCDYYDPDALANCRATGMSVEVREAGEQNVELKMKAVPKR